MSSGQGRVDVEVESKRPDDPAQGKAHPNTCPGCGSHYRGDAVLCGAATIEGEGCRLAIMDFAFMGGSMGSVVGEKFARACESASSAGAPLISVSASGGARMQEGILALMQLPQTVFGSCISARRGSWR